MRADSHFSFAVRLYSQLGVEARFSPTHPSVCVYMHLTQTTLWSSRMADVRAVCEYSVPQHVCYRTFSRTTLNASKRGVFTSVGRDSGDGHGDRSPESAERLGGDSTRLTTDESRRSESK